MFGRGFFLLLAVLLALAASSGAARAAGLTTAERALLSEINRARAGHGLPALRIDWRLQRAARGHSASMIRGDFFSHAAFSQRMRASRARGPAFGENLAWGTGSLASARAMVAQWLASPPHRANLLRRGFRRVGVATPAGNFRGVQARVATTDFAGA
jgi:uncharacterized protein YkwD